MIRAFKRAYSDQTELSGSATFEPTIDILWSSVVEGIAKLERRAKHILFLIKSQNFKYLEILKEFYDVKIVQCTTSSKLNKHDHFKINLHSVKKITVFYNIKCLVILG